MSESILTSTKRVLGIEESFTQFDPDITMHINSAFATLNQLGIGPEDGYGITDKTPTWDAFFGTNLKYNSIKTYVYLKVRLLFDPPQTSFAIDAYQKQIEEYEWRLNSVREETEWTDPDPEPIEDTVLDGGSA